MAIVKTTGTEEGGGGSLVDTLKRGNTFYYNKPQCSCHLSL